MNMKKIYFRIPIYIRSFINSLLFISIMYALLTLIFSRVTVVENQLLNIVETIIFILLFLLSCIILFKRDTLMTKYINNVKSNNYGITSIDFAKMNNIKHALLYEFLIQSIFLIFFIIMNFSLIIVNSYFLLSYTSHNFKSYLITNHLENINTFILLYILMIAIITCLMIMRCINLKSGIRNSNNTKEYYDNIKFES